MTAHQDNQKKVVLMWNEGNDIRFNVKKDVELNEGDFVFFKSGKTSEKFYFKVNKIVEKRQSSLTDYNYVTTESEVVIN